MFKRKIKINNQQQWPEREQLIQETEENFKIVSIFSNFRDILKRYYIYQLITICRKKGIHKNVTNGKISRRVKKKISESPRNRTKRTKIKENMRMKIIHIGSVQGLLHKQWNFLIEKIEGSKSFKKVMKDATLS